MTGGRKTRIWLSALLLICAGVTSCRAVDPPVEIGMTLHLRDSDAAALDRQFELMSAMDVQWVRVDIDWSVVERERGRFDWSFSDQVVELAAAHGMNVLAVLGFTPQWARASSTPATETAHYSRPEKLSDWAVFVQTAAERYVPRGIRTWEIWNEPNTSKFWPPRPDVNEYGHLFWVAADAVRAVDPEATLLIGGLGPKFEEPDAEVPPTEYLQLLYANGAAKYADGIAAHPYSFPSLPTDVDQRMLGGFRDLPELHAVMDRNGDGQKKIWITEFGAPTGTGPHAVSDQDQAVALLEARERLESWDWSGPLIYYELVDGGPDLSDTEQNFGVLREDLSLKPAAEALLDGASG